MRKQYTLCMVNQSSRILLGMKKRGFGAGRWNGFGGKVLPDETIDAAAVREMREEAGIVITKMEKVGVLDFSFQDKPEILEVHIFRVDEFDGEPLETEEMAPRWFLHERIPFDAMWPDDQYWLPLFLAGRKFSGHFLFGKNDAILDHELREEEII